MSNGNAIEFVQKNPEVDRLKLLTEIASGKCSILELPKAP